MAIRRDGCPWTCVCVNRYLSLTDRPSAGYYTGRSTAGGTGLSRIYIHLHVSLGPGCSLWHFNKTEGRMVSTLWKSIHLGELFVRVNVFSRKIQTRTVISLWSLLRSTRNRSIHLSVVEKSVTQSHIITYFQVECWKHLPYLSPL